MNKIYSDSNLEGRSYRVSGDEEFAPRPSHLDGQSPNDIIKSYFSILWKGIWFILLSVAFFLAIALVISDRIQPQYRAISTLEIKQQESNILGGTVVDQIEANEEFMITQISLLQSNSLIETVVEDLGLQNDPLYTEQVGSRADKVQRAVKKFKNNLEIQRDRSSRIIGISISGPRAKLAAQTSNRLVENFVRFTQERKFNATAFARNFIRERLDKTREVLEDSERELYEYTQSTAILAGGDLRNKLDTEALKALTLELESVRTQRLMSQNQLDEAKNEASSSVYEDSVLHELRKLKINLELEYKKKLQVFKHKHPDMLSLRAQIEEIEVNLNDLISEKIDSYQVEYESALRFEKQFERRVGELQRKMVSNQSEDFRYNVLLREVQTNRTQYDALLQRFKEISVADGVGSDLISIVDPATVPKVPFMPNKLLITAIAGLLGLILSVVAILIHAFLNNKIDFPNDIIGKLRIPLIGVIPLVSLKNESLLRVLGDPYSNVAEGYASARSVLSNKLNIKEKLCLQIVSSAPDEGKSSSSIGLALSFVETGRSVLLIDADFRKPGFRDPSEDKVGLLGVLNNQGALDDSVSYLPSQPNLKVLYTGGIPTNPVSVLSNPRFEKILAEAKSKFDVVVVDSPPVLGIADAVIIGSICDASLIVIEQNRLRQAQILDSIQRLSNGGANVIGGILTKYQSGIWDNNYGGYEYYSYGKNKKNKKMKIDLT